VINLPDRELSNNKISTAKYNAFNFLPINLFIQFTKLANVYFLVIGILEFIPSISNTNGLPSIWGPLVLIVLISMTKDFFEDRKRHNQDNEENNK